MKGQAIFSLDVNKPLGLQHAMQRILSLNHATCTVHFRCGIDHATYDLLTRQYKKNPELCSVRCEDEFGLEFYWNGALNPVLWFCGGIGAAGIFFSLQEGVTLKPSM